MMNITKFKILRGVGGAAADCLAHLHQRSYDRGAFLMVIMVWVWSVGESSSILIPYL